MKKREFKFEDTSGVCEICFDLMQLYVVATVKVSYTSILCPDRMIEKTLCADHALFYWRIANDEENSK